MSAVGVVYPCLVLIYLGQGAYLVANPATYSSLFYSAQPTPVYWPMFVISILASIVASQSIITGTSLCCLLSSLMPERQGRTTAVSCLSDQEQQTCS